MIQIMKYIYIYIYKYNKLRINYWYFTDYVSLINVIVIRSNK